MPSAFETQMTTAAMPALYQEFGLPATYTPPNGSTAIPNLTVRVQRGAVRQSPETDGEIQTGVVMVLASALATPSRGGRFMVENTEVWTIETTPELKNGEHVCTCSRSGRRIYMNQQGGPNV